MARADINGATHGDIRNKINANFIDLYEIALSHGDVANVKKHGAVGDGVTNDWPAFVAARDTGKDIFVPAGTYYIVPVDGTGANLPGGLLLQDGQNLFGVPRKSIIKATGDHRAIQLGQYSVVENLKFIGPGKATASLPRNGGIWVLDKLFWRVNNCEFIDFAGEGVPNGGGGMYVARLSTNFSEAGRISNCLFDNNKNGLGFAERAEYVTCWGLKFSNNTLGTWMAAGNIAMNACDWIKNTTAIKLHAGANHAHGVFSGCTINHNTTAIDALSIVTGHTFSGCMIYDGHIVLDGCKGIKFIACDLTTGNFTITNCTLTLIANCRFPKGATAGAKVLSVTGELPIEANNLDF